VPDLIVLRLHPFKPMSGADFTTLLNGLTLTAYDLSFGDSVTGVQLGTASGLADPHLSSTTFNNNVNINNTSILQHYVDVTPPPPPLGPGGPKARHLEAVATAVIIVTPPAGHVDYPQPNSYDIRLDIERNGRDMGHRRLDYNVEVVTVASLSSSQKVYFGMEASSYMTLPSGAGLDPAVAYVDLPPNGQPPAFDALCDAIDLVLAADPNGPNGNLLNRSPLTPAESRQVAAEIVWNRGASPPPDLPDPLGQDTFGAMYTSPQVEFGLDANDVDTARMRFEAELAGYYGTHEAQALRLAGFVFSASSAIADEVTSRAAERARLDFPVLTSGSTATTVPHASVALTETGGLTPSFIVPAAFYYALAAMLPTHVSAGQRYDMARLELVPRLLAEFADAVDAGFVAFPATPFTAPAAPAVNADQAARRLRALGSALNALPEVDPDPPIDTLVTDWLAHPGADATIDADFWTPEIAAQPAAYLELLLNVVTDTHTPLVNAIKAAPLNVADAEDLAAITDQAWRDFFLGQPPQIGLLPPFTQPGTPSERTEAFIRHLHKFFAVPAQPVLAMAPSIGPAPTLGLSRADALAAFAAAYLVRTGTALTFAAPLDQLAVEASAADVFPGDADAQAWLVEAVRAIRALFELTDIGEAELQFSLMEALYARGFTSAAAVSALSESDLAFALTGTVAYPHAADIYQQAGGSGPSPKPPPGPFAPVNPDGSLTDCIPPPHLSPLGPVEHLHELLDVSAASTCAEPLQQGDPTRLELLLAGRRGPLGDLHATRSNLETPLPLVDLVNESLEALAAGLGGGATGGVIYDTASDELAGHALATATVVEPDAHDPQTLFATMPEHSSPATPVEQPAAYDLLKSDFTAPGLPYPQALDVCRSYLAELGSSRYAAMRRFRKEITEFAIDPTNEPADFLSHLWRYPVKLETALEYVHISAEEYDLLYRHDIVDVATPGRLLLREVYGYPTDVIDGRPWTELILELPAFLERTGLEYCEFLELWHSGFIVFRRAGKSRKFPDCEPCCLDDFVIKFGQGQDPLVALRKLAMFIRLWRRLQTVSEPTITFAQLRDISDVLKLFKNDKINPEFIRQLAALLILRDRFCLPLADREDESPDATGADRTHLLALWVGHGAAKWDWAVTLLLKRLEDMADALALGRRGPDWVKVLADHLDPLSVLAGFDPAGDTWHAQPTSTLRFAEVLWKITLSEFTVGEVLFLFTVEPHLDGDDPFPLQPPNEARDDPLQVPDDEEQFGLWALRRTLLETDADEEQAQAWTWLRIVTTLRDELGFSAAPGADPLIALGEHFFPSILRQEGRPVDVLTSQYRANLPAAATSPLMWNTTPAGPFRYDPTSQELWTQLPLRDTDVAEQLSELRALTEVEQAAARNLYFSPRAALAPFALVFENFDQGVDRLVHEQDEEERFAEFRREFDRFYRRCQAIADHLAGHVANATGQEHDDAAAVAWRLLRTLWGDENQGTTPWEDDSGQPPQVTWQPQPTGGAFAALLGLAGTGLLGEIAVEGTDPAWRELRGPLSAFGETRNHWNAPVLTVIPSMGLTLTPDQLRYAAVRNGFAIRPIDGEPLFGAEPFTVRWRGALLIEEAGEYRFAAGAPTTNGERPDFEACEEHRWLVTVRRGQKRWFLLNHDWPREEEAPDAESEPIYLRRGVYEIVAELRQPEPAFRRDEDVRPRHTGFQVKYTGPDSENRLVEIPFDRLFRLSADDTLDAGLDVGDAAGRYLRDHYSSSLRDIRRTYQRAFKAVLFAYLFGLSASPLRGDRQSELGYMLDHAETFQGRSYFRTGPAAFDTHRAWFDFNLLPVTDPYPSLPPVQDQRVQPSARRQAALFDWWERIFDYHTFRRETREARERPAWRLFYEASERKPDDPAELLRNIGVDIRHAPLVLTYNDGPAMYALDLDDLEAEPWALRAWRGERWLRALEQRFFPRWIGAAEPALWASDDPGASTGNENLTAFVQNGSFENGEPRRYEDVRQLDDGLRERARAGLFAYLCGMNRVSLPFAPGRFAREPRDLSDLLLQDVESGICERASRIEEAVSAVQAFVQRARLGLEPSLAVSTAFVEVWEGRFASFDTWVCCRQRDVYRENWIDWDELRAARKVEAFRFLQGELREATLTVAVPGGLEWWPDRRPPAHPCLVPLQASEPAQIRMLESAAPENLDLLGTPEREARPSWLAPFDHVVDRPDEDGDDHDGGDDYDDDIGGVDDQPAGVEGTVPRVLRAVDDRVPASELEGLPLWIQAAVRLGCRFVRVAAAGLPLAKPFAPCGSESEGVCCADCGFRHEPEVDEYYFWLLDSRWFEADAVTQDADVGVLPPELISAWHDPERLPGLLEWPSEPTVQLLWSRVHNGEFQQPRRSSEGLPVDASALAFGELPQLDFMGRTVDSLRFEVSGGKVLPGYSDPTDPNADLTPPGFRYDLATDSAVVVPLVVKAPDPVTTDFPAPLTAYPFFTYFCPGAPVEPLSSFSVALAVAGALRAHCQFEAALKWLELVFNPLERDDTWAQCWHWERQPLDDGADQPPNGELDRPPPTAPQPDDSEQPPVWVRRATVGRRRGEDEPCCPNEALNDDVARDRAIMLHHLETLLQWGDALLCRNSPEAFRRADVIFDTVDRVLGERPDTVFARDTVGNPPTISAFDPRPAPLNPRLLALYDRTADRVALIHNCINGHRLRNGRPNIDMPYFGDEPIREGWRCTDTGCCECDDWCLSCCDAYRFGFRVQNALELAGEVRAFGAELLAAYEKGDGEYLASLRTTQERQLLELALDVRKNQWRDADWQVQALQKGKEGAQTRLRYYQTLIANGLNAGEIGYEALTGVSTASRVAGNVSEAIAQGIGMVPDFWIGIAGIMGTPLQFNQLPLGNKLAAGFATAARIMNALADIASSNAGLSLTQGGWDRREAEWRHQVEVIGIEIEQIERQILGSQRRRDIALRELNNHQRQIEHSIEMQNFLRDKFTNHELYLFLQQETSALYYQTYELALVAARQAQHAFNYERGYTTRTFLPDNAWDSLHEGLLAGERLQLAVRQMEKAYLDANCREYELTKHISLRLNLPLAFLQLQTTGYCEIEIPEWMFDLDYPGQYMRRIKNVTLTIPCVVGPYTGVHCRLTLLNSATRIDPRLNAPPVECCHEPCECECGNPCCCCEPAASGYDLLPADPRVVRAYAATEAIATSSGQNDSGLFELNFRDERYLPFEFAGAVSRWRIELPPETNYFDFGTLSDVVLHLNYTAREGGDVLRAAAAEHARCRLPGDGVRLFDVRRDLPDAWHELQQPVDAGPDGEWRRRLKLRLSESMFPFVPARRARWLDSLQIFFEAPCAEPSTNYVVRFLTGEHKHDHDGACECGRTDVHCIASSEWPGLFWGMVDLRGRRLGPMMGDRTTELGTFEFPTELGEICNLHLVTCYCAEPWPRCGEPTRRCGASDGCGCCGPSREEGQGHRVRRRALGEVLGGGGG
jgi:hypothetical protein